MPRPSGPSASAAAASAVDSSLTHILPALHHALSGSTGTVIATCTLYPLSLVIARLQVQRQLQSTRTTQHPHHHHPPGEQPQSSAASPSPQGDRRSAGQATSREVPGQSEPRPASRPRTHRQPTAVDEKEDRSTSQPGHEAPTHQQETREDQSEPTQAGQQKKAASGRATSSSREPARQEDQYHHHHQTDTSRSTNAGNAATEAEYTGILDAFSRIYSQEGGLKALYSGLTQDAAKSFLDSFLFFMFYEWFRGAATARRRRIRSDNGKQGLGVLEDLAVGMAAGACSRAFTTPIANVVTRKQTASLMDDDAAASTSEKSVMQILRDIRQEKGIQGLWGGYSATLLLTLNPSITFFLQDFLKKALLGSDRWDNPGPHMTFLLAASSKAAASAITYPFQIAKTRLQAGVPVQTEEDGGEPSRSSSQATLHDNTEHNHATVNPDGSVKVSQSETQAAEKKVDDKLRAISAMKKLAQKSIFGTIAHIVRTEGVGALYDGIQGELLKGFFSHGTTMVAKDVIHKLLFKLYLFTASLLAEWRARKRSTGPGGSGRGGGGGGGEGMEGIVDSVRRNVTQKMSRLPALPSLPGISIIKNKIGASTAGSGSELEITNLPVALQYRIPWNQTTGGAVAQEHVQDAHGLVNLVDGGHRMVKE